MTQYCLMIIVLCVKCICGTIGYGIQTFRAIQYISRSDIRIEHYLVLLLINYMYIKIYIYRHVKRCLLFSVAKSSHMQLFYLHSNDNQGILCLKKCHCVYKLYM